MRQNEKRRIECQNDNRMQEPISTKLNVCVFHALSKQKALKKLLCIQSNKSHYMDQTGTSDGKLV